MQKPRKWQKAAIKAIENRRLLEMQWQLSLTMLSQPAFTEEAAREKQNAVQEIYRTLTGEQDEFVPMDDSDTLALLAMAGRFPVRKIDASGTSDAS